MHPHKLDVLDACKVYVWRPKGTFSNVWRFPIHEGTHFPIILLMDFPSFQPAIGVSPWLWKPPTKNWPSIVHLPSRYHFFRCQISEDSPAFFFILWTSFFEMYWHNISYLYKYIYICISICIVICIYIYLEPERPLFWRFWPIKLKVNHPKEGSFGFQVYISNYCYIGQHSNHKWVIGQHSNPKHPQSKIKTVRWCLTDGQRGS